MTIDWFNTVSSENKWITLVPFKIKQIWKKLPKKYRIAVYTTCKKCTKSITI